ncbi:MAG: transposase [Mesorhizobium sp.]|nr:MAG: transposase [Mesorhizobium sp.]TIN90168.1 MAG: transposase [Mesorhizobium sp.]
MASPEATWRGAKAPDLGDGGRGWRSGCANGHAKHRAQHSYDPVLYRQRHRIENMFARLKDWRRIHTRYDRCAHTFLSAIAFAAAFIFWINES